MSLSLGNVFESTEDKESNIAKAIAINEWISHKVTKDFIQMLENEEKNYFATLVQDPYATSEEQRANIGQLSMVNFIKQTYLEERAISNENV